MFGKYTGKCSFWKRKREHARSSSPSFHRRARESYFRSRSIPAAFSGAGKGGEKATTRGGTGEGKGKEGGRPLSLPPSSFPCYDKDAPLFCSPCTLCRGQAVGGLLHGGRGRVERREGWWRKNEASLFFLFSQRVGEATYRIRHEGAFLAPLSLLSTYYARITKLSQSSSRPSTARINYVVRSGCGKKNLRTRLSRKKNLNYTFFLIPTSGNFLLPRANISRRRFALQKGEEGGRESPLVLLYSFLPPPSPPSLCVFVPCLSPRPEGDG